MANWLSSSLWYSLNVTRRIEVCLNVRELTRRGGGGNWESRGERARGGNGARGWGRG